MGEPRGLLKCDRFRCVGASCGESEARCFVQRVELQEAPYGIEDIEIIGVRQPTPATDLGKGEQAAQASATGDRCQTYR